VLLRSGTDIEGRNVDQLASYTDMTLTDKDTSVVDGLGQTLLVHLGLETAFQQLLSRQLKDSIEIQFIVTEETVSAHATKQGSTLKDTLRVLGVQCQQGTCGLSKLGKSILHTPDFALAAKSVLSNETKLGIQTFLFVGSTRSLECFGVCNELKEEGKRSV
jgi:hypothetical protein